MAKRFKIVINADEFFIADSLRNLANIIENDDDTNGIDGFEIKCEQFTATVNKQ